MCKYCSFAVSYFTVHSVSVHCRGQVTLVNVILDHDWPTKWLQCHKIMIVHVLNS